MSVKKVYHCQWCQREIAGYRACYDHERTCALNPEVQKVAAAAVDPATTKVELPGASAGADEKAEESPPAGKDAKEDPLVDPLQNLIDARIGARFAMLEQHIAQRDSEFNDKFTTAVNNVPAVIEKTVVNFLSAQMTAPVQETPPPVVTDPINGQKPPGPAGGTLGLLGKLDWQSLFLKYIESRGKGDPVQGLLSLLNGGSAKPRQTDPKYATRGMGNMLTMLRMKGADPKAQALAAKSQASQMLKEAGLDARMRDYFIGQQSICDAFLTGLNLEKETEKPPGSEGQ